MFLVVASAFLKKLKDWLLVFDASFLSSLFVGLIGLRQIIDKDWTFLGEMGRIGSTIGNAGYVAGFMVFNIFFGALLLFFRKNEILRIYYLLGIILQIIVTLYTYTRGGLIALFITLLAFLIYFTFIHLKDHQLGKPVRIGVIILLVAGFLLVGLIFVSKDADWVTDNKLLNRIVSISPQSTTAQNRLMTWESAWQGFKEKPVIGYGYENFYQAFDKNFNPGIYRHESSVVWFDRAHNIVFDRLVTGGIIGLLLYLALLFVPLWYLWKYYLKSEEESQYLIPVILTLIILGYFIQNLFIFEALVTYIPLFFVLAFLSSFCPDWKRNWTEAKTPYVAALTIGIIIFIPFFFAFNVKPVRANLDLVKSMTKAHEGNYREAYEGFKEILAEDTLGNQEYRKHFGELVEQLSAVNKIDQNWRALAAMEAEEEFDKQIEEKPTARNYLMAMRFLNKTYTFNIKRLDKALDYFEKAKELAPNRPQIYTEAAYSHFYLGKYYQQQGQKDQMKKHFEEAAKYIKKPVELNDKIPGFYANLIMILVATNHEDQTFKYLDQMAEKGVTFNRPDFIERINGPALRDEKYDWMIEFYSQLTDIHPDNPDYWVKLSLSYASDGQKEKAIEIAQKIKEFGGQYAAEADLFIENVEKGVYDK